MVDAPDPSPADDADAPAQPDHLIAVNCHPFHALDAVLAGLEPLARAADLLRGASEGRVETRLFWHGPDRAPERLRAALERHGIALTESPHRSNGANLNAQVAWAQAQGFDFFYRVDGDDAVFAQRFVLQAGHLARGRCDICGGGLRYEPSEGLPYDVLPPARPRVRDFLENRFILHPSMALRLAAFRRSGLRYWDGRLEDKALIKDADAAGLRIANLPLVMGNYRLGRGTRNGLPAKWLGFRLNLAFLWQRRAMHYAPYAAALFAAQVLLGADQMRRLRHALYHVETKTPLEAAQNILNKTKTKKGP